MAMRYVHSKQCVFVDMATPKLVEFMLDFHSQRPELFYFMKMEVRNKYINENKEEQLDRPDWVQAFIFTHASRTKLFREG